MRFEFTTTGFSQPINDARLRFWFGSFDRAGESYWIDGVVLVKVEDGTVGAASVGKRPGGKLLKRLVNGYYLYYDVDGGQAGNPVGDEGGERVAFTAQNRIKDTQVILCLDGTLAAKLEHRQIHRSALPVTTNQIGFAMNGYNCDNPTLTVDVPDYPARSCGYGRQADTERYPTVARESPRRAIHSKQQP